MTDCGRGPHLHVYPHRAMWRWTYHEPGGEDGRVLELRSSIAFPDAEEARSSATTAYPAVPVVDDEQTDESTPDEESPKRHRCRRTVPAALAAAVLVVTAVIILRQRAIDDHGVGRAGRARPPIEVGPRFRLRFRPRRRRVTAASPGAAHRVAR